MKKKSKTRKAAKGKAKVKKSSSKRSPVKTAKKAKKPAKGKKKKKAAKPIAAASSPRPTVIPPVNGILLGHVEDYFAQVAVIALTLQKPVLVGQRIQVLGHTTNIEQTVDSMQIDHVSVPQAAVGSAIGIKVIGRARRGDHVYLLK